MIAQFSDRTIARPSVSRRAQRGSTGHTTGGGQDKSAHIARRSGGWFYWVFSGFSHIAAFRDNVRHQPKYLNFLYHSHVAGPRHVR